MDAKLTDVYNRLKERYNDEKYLGIYTGKEANALYREFIDREDGCMDEDQEENTLYACNKFELQDNQTYIEGAYYIYFDEAGELIAVWAPSPSDVPKGWDNIIAMLDEYKVPSIVK